MRDRDFKVGLPYGKRVLELYTDIRQVSLITSKPKPPLKDPRSDLIKSLESPTDSPPLSELCKGVKRITVLIPDKTRAFPSKLVLPTVLRTIESSKSDVQVNVIIATGLHKPHTREEVLELVSKDVYSNYEVVSHDAEDEESLIDTEKRTSYNTPVIVNENVIEADLVVGLGLIEPHFFAGYSGGRKSVLPGVAGKRAIYVNHGFKMIGNPNSKYGVLEGNPIHEDMVEFMKLTKLDFIVNVTIGKEKRVTGVFCGNPVKAHLNGVRFLEEYVKVRVKGLADVVITTNGGYPLDRNLYQAVKGMATGELVVKEGGVIIIVAECVDGLGEHEEFYELFVGAESPDEVLEKIRRLEPIKDQWEAQILARILKKAKVIVVSEMRQSIIEDMLMIPASTINEALDEALKLVRREETDVRLTVIPEGPYVIPEIANFC